MLPRAGSGRRSLRKVDIMVDVRVQTGERVTLPCVEWWGGIAVVALFVCAAALLATAEFSSTA